MRRDEWNGFGMRQITQVKWLWRIQTAGYRKQEVLSLSSAVLQEAYIEHVSESSNKIRHLALFPVLHKRFLEDVGVNLHSSCANYTVYYKFVSVKC